MHLSQLPSGRWRVSVKFKGERATASASTKQAARLMGAQLLVNLGARQTPDTVPVGELIDGHLQRVAWSPTTVYDAQLVAQALPEPFRTRPVADVDGAVIAALYRQLQTAGWSAHRIRRAHMVLSTAWSEAITWGWATRNPCRDVKPPKTEPRDIHPPETDQVRRILDACDTRFHLFVRLAATTGARRGELVALQWQDVDLDAGAIIVRRALVQTGGTPIMERDTKTARKGHRVIALDPFTTAALRTHRSSQGELALAAGFTPTWLFSHDAGATPWRPDYPSRRFRQVRGACGVTGVRLHDLRHYVATTMLHDGEDLALVAQQLGHASQTTTSSVYAHWLPGRGRESVERRAARLNNSG